MRPIVLVINVLLVLSLIACNGGRGKSEQQDQQNQEGQTDGQMIDSALAALNKRISENPGDYSAYLERARYFGARENYKEAYQDIARAISVDSTKADIYLYKGELLFKQQLVAEAYDEYKKCIHFDSVNVDGLLNKTGIDIVLGNYDLARLQINTALRQNEYNPYAYYLRGRMYKTLGDTSLASSSYKTAIEVDPDYYDAYIEVGLLYAAKKNDLAKEYYTSAIELRPASIEAWYNKAMFLQETGYKKKERYREAFACYDSILRIDEKFVAANFNKGYIWLEYLNQYDSAAFYFTKAVQVFPEYYQAYYNRGLCHESMGRRKEAETDYRQALALKPDYTDAAKSLDRLLRGK